MSYEDSGVKVWWIPQIPMKSFEVPVPDIQTGAWLCDVLANYDLFQYNERVKPDYSNAGGVEFIDTDGEWTDVDYEDPDDVEYAQSVLISRNINDRKETA